MKYTKFLFYKRMCIIKNFTEKKFVNWKGKTAEVNENIIVKILIRLLNVMSSLVWTE